MVFSKSFRLSAPRSLFPLPIRPPHRSVTATPDPNTLPCSSKTASVTGGSAAPALQLHLFFTFVESDRDFWCSRSLKKPRPKTTTLVTTTDMGLIAGTDVSGQTAHHRLPAPPWPYNPTGFPTGPRRPAGVSLPRDRFWDVPVPKIDSPTRQPLVPRPPCVRAHARLARWQARPDHSHNGWTAFRMRLHVACSATRPRPTPTGDYPPRASHFLGGQRWQVRIGAITTS